MKIHGVWRMQGPELRCSCLRKFDDNVPETVNGTGSGTCSGCIPFCHILLVLTLEVHLDFLCLRAQEYAMLIEIAEGFDLPCSLPSQTVLRLDCAMPNFAYAAALALHHLKCGGRAAQNADEAAAIGTVSVEDLTLRCWKRDEPKEEGASRSHVALMHAMLLFPRLLRPILQALSVSLATSPAGSPYSAPWQQLLEKSPFAPQTHVLHKQYSRMHGLVSEAFVHRCAALFRGDRTLRWMHACAGRLTQMCESSLFEKELMQERKSWSEAELGVGEALSKDFHEFNTLEVEAERKPPVILELAFNSWVGTPAALPAEEESEESLVPRFFQCFVLAIPEDTITVSIVVYRFLPIV